MARFEWARIVAFDGPSKPGITSDDILDAPAAKLRLGLQPYLSLLDLNYPVDDFLIAVKKRELDVLRGEASNAVDSAPTVRARARRRIWLFIGMITCSTTSAWIRKHSRSFQRSVVAQRSRIPALTLWRQATEQTSIGLPRSKHGSMTGPHLAGFVARHETRLTSRNGKIVRLGLPRIIRLKENAPELDYSSFYGKRGSGKTNCFVMEVDRSS